MTSRDTADSLIILLHGVGSSGSNMMALADSWREALPRSVFAAPDAPIVFDQGAGRQWFSVSGVTEQSRAQRIEAARPAFDRVIHTEIKKHGFTDRLSRVALVGFSQGSMMLLDAVANGRWPVAAAVAFAGRLATHPPFAPASPTRLLLVHGAADPVVPVSEMERARASLAALGFAIESRLFSNVGHMIAPEAASAAAEFIQTVLNTELLRRSF